MSIETALLEKAAKEIETHIVPLDGGGGMRIESSNMSYRTAAQVCRGLARGANEHVVIRKDTIAKIIAAMKNAIEVVPSQYTARQDCIDALAALEKDE